MILLLGFRAFDDFDAEYQVTDLDAKKLANLVGHPGADKVTFANVTFFHEGLTDEICKENLRWAEHERDRDQLEFPQAVRPCD